MGTTSEKVDGLPCNMEATGMVIDARELLPMKKKFMVLFALLVTPTCRLSLANFLFGASPAPMVLDVMLAMSTTAGSFLLMRSMTMSTLASPE